MSTAEEVYDAQLQKAVRAMREQLLIVLCKRMQGPITIHVDEIDDTGQDILEVFLNPETKIFTFKLSKKN